MSRRTLRTWILIGVGILIVAFSIACWVSAYRADIRTQNLKIAKYLSRNGYAAVFGVEHMEYAAFFETYGEPDKIEYVYEENVPRMWVIVEYPSFQLQGNLWEKGSAGSCNFVLRLQSITVKDASLRFGEKQIGLGSTRTEVETAYCEDTAMTQKQIEETDLSADIGFWGDYWTRILFCFDENDRVSAMMWKRSTHY